MTDSDEPFDNVDRQIVELLQENARRTFQDIGRHVGLSAPTVKRRVERLEQSGILRGYTILINYTKMGRALEVFAELRVAGRTRVEDIERIAAGIRGVEAVFTVAGDPDALAWIRVRDMNDLKDVMEKLRRSGKVTATRTMMVLGSSTRGIPAKIARRRRDRPT